MTTAAILNVTGYVGAELARLLHAHPRIEVKAVTGRSLAGKRLPEVFPHLFSVDLPIVESISPGDTDIVFSALPHAAAAEQLVPFIEAGVPVVDVSADFRLRRVEQYEAAYKTTHPAPHLLHKAVFGLPELHHDEIAESKLVGASGCHSAGVILALAPLFAEGLVEPEVVADTKTGLSGAGRALGLNVHFSEADENVAPYGLDGHRHLPEMTQELGLLAEAPPPTITFVPHYTPMARGILSTCYVTTRDGVTLDRARLLEVYRAFYARAPFIRVVESAPSTKLVAGTNYCLVHPTVHGASGQVVVASALDNLGKGASGNAVQCANLMLGLPEDSGLQALGLFP
jgi:N-acetyl-gamma-glutamyl-phosphate reductase